MRIQTWPNIIRSNEFRTSMGVPKVPKTKQNKIFSFVFRTKYRTVAKTIFLLERNKWS